MGRPSRLARLKASACHAFQWTAKGDAACDMNGADYNEGMFTLRYVAVVAAAVWAGGLLALGAVAAPSIFDVIAARGVADGRIVAGAIFGEALRRFHLVAYVCGIVIAGTLLARALLGPRPVPFGPRLTVSVIMLVAALYSGVILSGQIERARSAAGGAPSALAPEDPRRVTFGRLHAFSTILQIVPLLGGLAIIFWELRDR